MKDRGPLHIAYRPGSFEEFVGNESMLESLKSILGREKGKVRSFLFQGPSGTGKTTLARIIQKELDCSDRNFHEFNSANTRGIDTIRDIVNNSKFAALNGGIKIYLLDEAHKLTSDAQNALLKILEDTPGHVRFILCTTDPDKLINTIKTRCTVFQVSPLPRRHIVVLLKRVCKEEGVEFPDKHYNEIALVCEGSPRKALNILDQIIDISDDETAYNAILEATVSETEVKEIIDYLMTSGKKDWKVMAKLIKGIDMSSDKPEKIRLSIKGYFGSVFLNRGDEKSYRIMALFLDNFYASGREGLIDALKMAVEM